jgi:hypothetical protein
MKIKQRKPQHTFLKKERIHVWEIPTVTTSGDPASPYKYNNCVHAAVFSLLAGLKCHKKKALMSWLETAEMQLADGIKALKKAKAKVVPS